MKKADSLFDLSHTRAGEYLKTFPYPWQALKGLKDFIISLGKSLNQEEYRQIYPQVWVHESVEIAPTTCINPPCVIDEGTQVRPGAFIRGSALIGKNCVVGNSTELKNVILFDNVQVPHYNYVGDSILGYKSHMGAGAITSNVKSDKTSIMVGNETDKIDTGLKKLGAIIGDGVEVGCNSVLNPGTIIGKNTTVYPLSCVRGTVAGNSIYKGKGDVVVKKPQAERYKNENASENVNANE